MYCIMHSEFSLYYSPYILLLRIYREGYFRAIGTLVRSTLPLPLFFLNR